MSERTIIKLDQIVEEKRRQIEEAKAKTSLDELKNGIQKRDRRSFKEAIQNAEGVALIAEMKKASPSKGLLCPDFSIERLTDVYAENGASALSVLTEPTFFLGDPSFVELARSRCELPVLRKDFILDEYQIYESRFIGADCILLITALLSADKLADFADLAHRLEMETLIEVHSFEEIERSLPADLDVIGVNNRNLKTMNVTLSASQSLSGYIPDGLVKISESGIATREHVEELQSWGYKGMLVGETLVTADDPGEAMRILLGKN